MRAASLTIRSAASDERTRDPIGERRYVTAGRAFAIGIICFALWFFFDARQLYQNAIGSPIGVRRSVSMTILRPVARAEELLGLDRLVNGANRLIGKTGSTGGSALGTGTPPASTSKVTPTSTVSTTPSNAGSTGTGRSGGVKGGPPPTKGPAPIAQPSVTHPLTILDIGDSIGEDLGIGLANQLGGVPQIHLLAKSVGNTGLANLGYYNWPAELQSQLRANHPKVVVVMLGGNDIQSFMSGNAVIQLGTPQWRTIYTQRVGEIMSEATSAGAHVIWVGLPIMGPTSGLSNTYIRLENSIFASEARSHPGVAFVSTWRLFSTPSGQYSTFLNGPNGALIQVRDPDQVHIDPPGGTDRLASLVVQRMAHIWHIKL